MPPKKSAKSTPKKGGTTTTGATPNIDPNSSFTQQSFERELKNLSTKARTANTTTFPSRKKISAQAIMYLKSLCLLLLIALYSNVSQLVLTPTYGSIPASINHPKVVMLACFVGWSTNLLLVRVLPFKPIKLLPVIAVYIPTVQYFMGFATKRFSTVWGPALTEMLTLFPLMVISVAVVATWLEAADFSLLPSWLGDALPGFGSYGFYKFAEDIASRTLPPLVGTSFFFTRMGMEMWLSAIYTAIAPSKLLLLTLPGVFHFTFFNTHVMDGMAFRNLQGQYQQHGWSIHERQESLTGYLSVMENHEAGFRIMRCDHSLLGGEWTNFPAPIVAEPIYGVFAMLEAVRLVETPRTVTDSDSTALVIGMGIGTSPAALIMHGITTTVVEIDPAVSRMAEDWFHLPTNITSITENAVTFASTNGEIARLHPSGPRYTYIIHDVFTGGAEPVDLFTLEFFEDLAALLSDDGVIAINYAGDFMLPSPALVVRTVLSVFPTCRIFRESERESNEALEAHGRGDFTNMVIFCIKATEGALKFRQATRGDMLQSRAREMFLVPKHEVLPEVDLYGVDGDVEDAVVRRNETGRLSVWHLTSAVGHWKVMRSVVPYFIWELW